MKEGRKKFAGLAELMGVDLQRHTTRTLPARCVWAFLLLCMLMTSGIIDQLTVVPNALAQSAGELRFASRSPLEQDLPPPGYPFTIGVELLGTRESRQKVHVVVRLDGRAVSIALGEGSYSINDTVEFKTEIPAPLYSLEYNFVLELEDGSLLFSDRMGVARSCRADITPFSADQIQGATERARLEAVYWASKKLEGELVMYEQINKLLAEIEKLRTGS